ncbi:hypothetical protein TNIN_384961 [Trichonephila inaurata madagascariensis]|uniref:Uncharacterized protein n=1 Tax=Trichonephila inaurata madagascariensis TaxID=2747483 RepID=A0A8X6YD10_9ARAC|nr:hypothetical protein TNIN_384961 [Trichonephila inaurata madagascariensis]
MNPKLLIWFPKRYPNCQTSLSLVAFEQNLSWRGGSWMRRRFAESPTFFLAVHVHTASPLPPLSTAFSPLDIGDYVNPEKNITA